MYIFDIIHSVYQYIVRFVAMLTFLSNSNHVGFLDIPWPRGKTEWSGPVLTGAHGGGKIPPIPGRVRGSGVSNPIPALGRYPSTSLIIRTSWLNPQWPGLWKRSAPTCCEHTYPYSFLYSVHSKKSYTVWRAYIQIEAVSWKTWQTLGQSSIQLTSLVCSLKIHASAIQKKQGDS